MLVYSNEINAITGVREIVLPDIMQAVKGAVGHCFIS